MCGDPFRYECSKDTKVGIPIGRGRRIDLLSEGGQCICRLLVHHHSHFVTKSGVREWRFVPEDILGSVKLFHRVLIAIHSGAVIVIVQLSEINGELMRLMGGGQGRC